MRPLDHPMRSRAARVYRELFGDGQEPVLDEEGRCQVAAQVIAQEIRDNPRWGLSAAEEPDRHAIGRACVAMWREREFDDDPG